MYRNLLRNTTLALGTLLVSSSLVLAGGLQGQITALDGKGMATVRTSDGKDHQIKVGQDVKVGSTVDCEMKNNAMECRAGAAHSAAPPVPKTSAPTAATQTPAKPSAAPTAQAPAHSTPAQPAAAMPAPTAQPAPAQTSSTMPSASPAAPAAR